MPLPERPQQRSSWAQGRSDEERKELLQPLTEAELLELIRVLGEAAPGQRAQKKPLGTARMDPDRLAVVLNDAVAVLVSLHARRLSQRVNRRAMPPGRVEWTDTLFRAMVDCGQLQFEGRGGLTAFDQTLGLVERHRRQLDPLILESIRLRGDPRVRGRGTRGGPR